jgi:hypothetical protein
LDESVLQIKTKIVSCHTADSKPVKQEVNGTVILPPQYSLVESWASLCQQDQTWAEFSTLEVAAR